MSIKPLVLLVGELLVMPGERLTSMSTLRASRGMSVMTRCWMLRLTDAVEVSSKAACPVTWTDSLTWPSSREKSAVDRMPVLTMISWAPRLKPGFSTETS